ncbi:hypothetical protein THAR02_06390 [Trichoderma harzianum]|uniref:Uncharacterized protein n=1 Tax=Trichoderma harzianum TaxID=5544 RepID=A0A0F9X8D4_TRIHA|nr:hypothetical protein THAR02_06390 [Trichoderma harzianum]
MLPKPILMHFLHTGFFPDWQINLAKAFHSHRLAWSSEKKPPPALDPTGKNESNPGMQIDWHHAAEADPVGSRRR